MAYHYAKKVTISDNEPEALQRGLKWAKQANGKPFYTVRSDGGGMSTRNENCESLTEARKIARQRARDCGWAEVFRWGENAVMLRKHFVCTYERELQA